MSSRNALLVILTLTALSTGFYFLTKVEKFSKLSFMSLRQVNDLQYTPDCIFEEEVSYYEYSTPESDPKMQKTNKFGLYVYAENAKFFELAQNLVNSNGGDWGFVLIPYNIEDTDSEKWERVFEQLRSKHLIPVIQLHAEDLSNYKSDTDRSAKFLNSFVWPAKERYISVYNEMNDSRFWFNKADPNEYARVLDYTIDAFKKVNTNYKIMNGALNVSATAGNGYIDAFEFMKKMNEEKPGIFERLDYWASHPYPQPGFRGKPTDTGRNSIKAYYDELYFLHNNLKISKELKVFITETGWPHAEGEEYNPSYYNIDTVSTYTKEAFEKVWLPDPLVMAVMPFTIWYNKPFDHFSWINNDYVPYAHYETIKNMEKISGNQSVLVPHTSKTKICN